jgi:hypothetical protein
LIIARGEHCRDLNSTRIQVKTFLPSLLALRDQVRAKFDRLTDGKLDKGPGREISAIVSEIDTVPVKH